MRTLRYWLIRKLAGKDMIMVNVSAPSIRTATFSSMSGNLGYVANSTFTNTDGS